MSGKDMLIREFIADYQRSYQDPTSGPDPSSGELVDLENELGAILRTLALPSLDQAAQDELKGKRTADLPDLMLETADGLRACPQIRAALDTDPEVFEGTVLQDTGLSGLIQVLQTLSARADTGQLLCASETERFCQDVEAQIRGLSGDALSRANLGFAEAMSRRQQGLSTTQTAAAATRLELRPHQAALKTAEEQAALEGDLRLLAVAAMEQPSVETKLKKAKAPAPRGPRAGE